MIGLLKYGNGLPFHRLDGLQENLGMPLPSSTQWEIVAKAYPRLQPAYKELVRQAAQGHVLHNDDTTVKILELMGERARAAALPPPIQMCDALSRNQNDQLAREQHQTAEERLRFHQQHSGPTMEHLRDWLKRQIEEKLVEPNSGLGAAINYLRKHWEKLPLFLRVAGAPLDNNLCERALKKAILHRKNALFFKTRHGAAVGDLYLSLIHTCELNGGNPFDYLTALQRHASAVALAPGEWMPWNYSDRLTCLADAG